MAIAPAIREICRRRPGSVSRRWSPVAIAAGTSDNASAAAAVSLVVVAVALLGSSASGSRVWPSSDALSALALGAAQAARPDAEAPALGMKHAGASELSVVNVDNARRARVSATFSRIDPSDPAVAVAFAELQPGSGVTVPVEEIAGLSAGAFSADLGAEERLAVVLRTEWPRTGGAAMLNQVAAASEVVLPLLASGHRGQTSVVAVHNADPVASARVGIAYFGLDGHQIGQSTTLAIAPDRSAVIDYAATSGPGRLPADTLGWALVSADVPVVVQSFVDLAASQKGVYGFEGIPADRASPTLFAPTVYNGRRIKPVDPDSPRRSTLIALVNATSASVRASIDYRGRVGGCATRSYHQEASIPARGLLLLGGPSDEAASAPLGLPADCGAAAVVHADGGSLVGLAVDTVSTADPNVELAGAYTLAAPAEAARRVSVPVARKGDYGLVTSIYVMNPGSAPAVAALRLFDSHGRPVVDCDTECQATVAPQATWLWWLDRMPVPSDLVGRAVVEGDTPLLVVVVE